MAYIRRSLEPVLKKATAEFPAVVLTGPRQSGKTTLLRHAFGDSVGYVSLEAPDVRASAIADPRGFLEANPPPVIFDEMQYAPELMFYIKERIDQKRSAKGQYLLTGSQNLLLLEQVTESLAGRAALLRLLPLSYGERQGRPGSPFPWEKSNNHPASPATDLWAGLLRGGYPELAAEPGRDSFLRHGSYIQTYLERDVGTIRQVGDLVSFQAFLRALAGRSGQLLSLTDLARDLGVAVNTIKAWISVLEASFQIIVVRPYFANIGKRLVKMPKIYFTDTGTLCYLTGLRDPRHAAEGPLGRAIFETSVLMEIVKRFSHRGQEAVVYFWRTSTGSEVDIIVDQEGRLIPLEVKLSATPRPAMAASIVNFREAMGKKAAPGYVVHTGDSMLPLAPGVTALPFTTL